jgi:hypothetical protein
MVPPVDLVIESDITKKWLAIIQKLVGQVVAAAARPKYNHRNVMELQPERCPTGVLSVSS